MKNMKTYTRKQIAESIVHWSKVMLENDIVTESELKSMLDEGLFKRAIGAMKRGIEKVKDTASSAKAAAKEALHDIFKPNEGVKKMLAAIASIAKDGKDKIKDAKVYATLGNEVLPVKDFAMKGKRSLMLLVDKAAKDVKPKTLDELRNFLHDKLGKAKVKDAIEGIYCAEAPKEALDNLNESKLGDYIDSKKLTKDDALKPENLKELKKMTKQNDEKTKAAIEKHFAKKGTSTPSKPAKTQTKAKKMTKKGTKDASSKTLIEPENKSEQKKPNTSNKDAIKVFDNKLLDVKSDKSNIGFMFSKSKAEIALDKEYADQFEV